MTARHRPVSPASRPLSSLLQESCSSFSARHRYKGDSFWWRRAATAQLQGHLRQSGPELFGLGFMGRRGRLAARLALVVDEDALTLGSSQPRG